MSGIVIDNGSGVIKAGFTGENHPSVIVPTLISEPGNLPLIDVE